MHLVPAPAVRLMKRRVQSRPGVRQENRPSHPLKVGKVDSALACWTRNFSSLYPLVLTNDLLCFISFWILLSYFPEINEPKERDRERREQRSATTC